MKVLLPKVTRTSTGQDNYPFTINAQCAYENQPGQTALGATADCLFIPDGINAGENNRLSLPTPLAAPLHFCQMLDMNVTHTNYQTNQQKQSFEREAIAEWRGLLALLALHRCGSVGGSPATANLRLHPIDFSGAPNPFLQSVIHYLPKNDANASLKWPEERNGQWMHHFVLLEDVDANGEAVSIGMLSPECLIVPSASYVEDLREARRKLPFVNEKTGRFLDPLTLTHYVGGKERPQLNWLQLHQLEQWLIRQQSAIVPGTPREIELVNRLGEYIAETRNLCNAHYPTSAGQQSENLPDHLANFVSPDIQRLVQGSAQKVSAFMNGIIAQLGAPLAFGPIVDEDELKEEYRFAYSGETPVLLSLMNCCCAEPNTLFLGAVTQSFAVAGIVPPEYREIFEMALAQACGIDQEIFAERISIINLANINAMPFAHTLHKIPGTNAFALLPLRPGKLPRMILEADGTRMANGEQGLFSDVTWNRAAPGAYSLTITLLFAPGVPVSLTREYPAQKVDTVTEARGLFNSWVWPAMRDEKVKAYYVYSAPHSDVSGITVIHRLEPLPNTYKPNEDDRHTSDRHVWQLKQYPWFMVLKSGTGADEGILCAWQSEGGVITSPKAPDPSGTTGAEDVSIDFGSSSSVVYMKNLQTSLSVRHQDALLSRRLLSNADEDAPGRVMRSFVPEMMLDGASDENKEAYNAMLNRIPSAVIVYHTNAPDKLPVLDYNIYYDMVTGATNTLGIVYSDLKWGVNNTLADARMYYFQMLILLCALSARAGGMQDGISNWRLGYPSCAGESGRDKLLQTWRDQIAYVKRLKLTEVELMDTCQAASEGYSSAKYFTSLAAVDTKRGFCSVDIGGSTTDITIYPQAQEGSGVNRAPVFEASLRFAGRQMLLEELLYRPQVLNLLLGAEWNSTSGTFEKFAKGAPKKYRPLREIEQLIETVSAPGFYKTPANVRSGWFFVDNLLRWFSEDEISHLMRVSLREALTQAETRSDNIPQKVYYDEFIQNLRFKLAMVFHLTGYVYGKVLGEEGIQILVGGNGSRIAYWCDPGMIRPMTGAPGIEAVEQGPGRQLLQGAFESAAKGKDGSGGKFMSCALSTQPKQEVARGLASLGKDAFSQGAGSSSQYALDANEWVDKFEAWCGEACADGGWLRMQQINFTTVHRLIDNAAGSSASFDDQATVAMDNINSMLKGHIAAASN